MSKLLHKILSISIIRYFFDKVVRTLRLPEILIVIFIDLIAIYQVALGQRSMFFVITLFILETFLMYLSWALRYLVVGQVNGAAKRGGLLYEWAGNNRVRIILVDVFGIGLFVFWFSFGQLLFLWGLLSLQITASELTTIMAIGIISIATILFQALLVIIKKKTFIEESHLDPELNIISRLAIMHVALFVFIAVYSLFESSKFENLHLVQILLTIGFIICSSLPSIFSYFAYRRQSHISWEQVNAPMQPEANAEKKYNQENSADQQSLI